MENSAAIRFASAGMDMLHLTVNLKFRVDPDPLVHASPVSGSCCNWLTNTGLCDLLPGCMQLAPSFFLSMPCSRTPVVNNVVEFLSSICKQADLVVTLEDKDPSICWLQIGPCFVSRWCNLLCRSECWQIVDIDDDVSLEHYRRHSNRCLPRFLWKGDDMFHTKKKHPHCVSHY